MRRAPDATPTQTRRNLTGATIATLGLVAGVWVQELLDLFAFGGRLDSLGIRPRDPGTFWHVLTAPFLHGGLGHLITNTVPLAVLAFLSAMRNVWRFLGATLLIVVLGGALVWLFARGGSLHLGASLLVFGYLGYLLGVGWWERTPAAIGVAAVTFLLYGGLLWGVLPGSPWVSWEAHLFGFLAGLVSAALLHGRRPRQASSVRPF